jgi:hypothetical protein
LTVLRCLLVHDREPDLGTQRRREGQATLLAFLHVERRGPEHVAHEVEARVARVGNDREDGSERSLQTLILARFTGHGSLEELRVGFDLGSKQVRHFLNDFALGEALPDTLLLGEGIAHGHSTGELREAAGPPGYDLNEGNASDGHDTAAPTVVGRA